MFFSSIIECGCSDQDLIPSSFEFLDLLSSREQFDEFAKLFEHTLGPWSDYTEEERKRIVANVAALNSKGPA